MKKIIQGFHNLRLQNKLILSYLIIVLIPLLLWSYFSYKETSFYLINQANSSFRNIFESTAESFEKKIYKTESILKIVTNNEAISEVLNNKYANTYAKYYDVSNIYDPLLKSIQSLHLEIKNVYIYTDGDIKNSRENFYDLQDPNGKNFVSILNNTIEPMWIWNGKQLIIAQKSFSTQNIESAGIASFVVDSDYIFKNNAPKTFTNYGMILFDESGNMVYKEEMLNSSSIVLSQKTSLNDIKKICDKNHDILMLSENVTAQGWTLCMYEDIHNVLDKPSKTAFQSTTIVVAISFFLMLSVIILFSRSFVKRIELLKLQLPSVISNHFKTGITSIYQDEIGDVTNSINCMIKETRTLIDEVYKNKISLREAEIKALQSQINPHFLYNTLSAINWKAVNSGNVEISYIVTSLSNFYRATLNMGNKNTTVKDELINTKAYLSIQLSIHNNSFDVIYNISPSILEFEMPNIILQPIVENAIEHGVDLKKDGRGIININAFESGNEILFEIIDNGNGIDDETINNILIKNKKGYGVKNVNDRLKLFFSEDYGVTFYKADNGGTKVIIKIPKYVEI